MSDTPLPFQPAHELSQRLKNREISATELTELFLSRIEKLNDISRAFITVTAEEALNAARSWDDNKSPEKHLSIFSGIPFASKDLLDIKGVKTTGGSRVLADNVASETAHVVEKLLASHAISLGKTNLHEFAYGATGENAYYGTAVNAYDTTRLAGGSSSGSAAAVAFGLCPVTFGTDTGGSIRVPAALNGLVGLKPTMGRLSSHGVAPYCWSLDHVGIISRDIRDCADMLQLTAGYDPRDASSVNTPTDNYIRPVEEASSPGSLRGLKIGIPGNFFYDRVDPQILAATDAARRTLEQAGATCVDVNLPDMEHCRTVSLTVQMPEALSFHSRYLEERGDLYGEDFRAGLALGQCLLAEHYVRAKRMMSLYRQKTNEELQKVDVLLTPSTPITAPHLGSPHIDVDGVTEPVGNAITRLTAFFNLTGHPAITVPSGLHSNGLPMGIQLVGRYFDEATILKVAGCIEAEEAFRIPPPSLANEPSTF